MMDSGILKVEKTLDGYVFSNPGSLKLPIECIYEGGHSKARNPRMQNMLRMIGFGENIGSGFPSILQAWHKESWRMPDLHEETDLRLVELKTLDSIFGVKRNRSQPTSEFRSPI